MRHKRVDIMDNDNNNNILDIKLYELYNRESQSSGGSLDKAKSQLYTIIKNELSKKQADVLFMYYFQNLKQQDIADRLNIGQSSVSRTIRRAKDRIEKILKYII